MKHIFRQVAINSAVVAGVYYAVEMSGFPLWMALWLIASTAAVAIGWLYDRVMLLERRLEVLEDWTGYEAWRLTKRRAM